MTQHNPDTYINSKDFQEAIQQYYIDEKITSYIQDCFLRMIKGLSIRWTFVNYTQSFKEEMIGIAKLSLMSSLRSKKYIFGTGYPAFAYFNTIAYNSFLHHIKQTKRINKIKRSYQLEKYKEILEESNDNDQSLFIKDELLKYNTDIEVEEIETQNKEIQDNFKKFKKIDEESQQKLKIQKQKRKKERIIEDNEEY